MGWETRLCLSSLFIITLFIHGLTTIGCQSRVCPARLHLLILKMFPSTTNANLFPHLSPSDHHQLSPPPFLGQNAADIFLHHHHHHDLLMADFLSADSSVTETLFGMFISDKSAITNQESNELNGHDFGPKDNLAPEKTAPKKVTHRKIYTAQGLRDRRVRLSIEIARKFFDLQDMLGFRKASKTIDWLLANSKKEIKDLMNKVKNSSSTTTAAGGGVKSSSLSSASQGEVVAGTYNIGVVSKMKKLKSVCKGKKVKLQKDRATLDHLLVSREARARARARARERTREKILRSKLKTSPIVSDEQKIS